MDFHMVSEDSMDHGIHMVSCIGMCHGLQSLVAVQTEDTNADPSYGRTTEPDMALLWQLTWISL